MNNIYITGFMSSGKTTVSKILSNICSKELYDTDAEIEKKLGMKTSEIFDKFGQEHFRKVESETLFELSKKDNCIISTGGGIVIDANNRQIMKNSGIIICIMPEFSVIESRLETAKLTRPLLNQDTELIKNLYDSRLDYYNDCSFMITPDENTTPEEIADQINILIGHYFGE